MTEVKENDDPEKTPLEIVFQDEFVIPAKIELSKQERNGTQS